ncbi:GPCP2-like protein [Mya arenaria]|uniref:GPCP2-like protein n=1 Tax=Mya arenaria TaxID=6604 RepID=A0ABY7GJM7_MYAAR|nr:GPCP2-like protein [Mya arenaria]
MSETEEGAEKMLDLHGEPLAFWKPKYSGQTYSIKCTPIDHSYKKVLEKGRSKPRPQSKFGPVVQQNSFVTFHAQTSDPESLGFQLDLYVDEDNKENETARHVGSSFILPLSMKKSRGSKNIPINGNNNRPIGQLTYTYLLIKPILAIVQENTIRSFQTAANHGADFVEFDVHLTKDEIPIIYHDFKVLITYRKKKREDLELFEIPVKDITCHTLPPHQSINMDGSGKIKDYFDLNRFVDIILSDVFKNHGGRRIVFSSFEPDICSMLRLKQNVFPVLFLSQADTSRYVPYAGIRTQSVVMATEFALSAGLLGVDVISDMLVKDMSQIRYVKDAGLVLFVWGEGCNDKEFIIQLKENKVDGIIYDRIDFYKTGPKESIFKLEEKQKRHLLETLGSLTITEESLDSGTDSP